MKKLRSSYLFFLLLSLMTIHACTNKSNEKTEKITKGKKKVTYSDSPQTTESVIMKSNVAQFLQSAEADFSSIPDKRKEKLERLGAYIRSEIDSGQVAQLTFICTHNSRRSHFGQIWAKIAATHLGFGDKVETYSGGTEATAFNPRAVAAMERAGVEIQGSKGANPTYTLYYAEGVEPIRCISKTYDDPQNPNKNFAAVMTCSQADEACPFIPGADWRVAIPYEDPKVSDGSPEEAATYDERCKQIATEMLYAMSGVQ